MAATDKKKPVFRAMQARLDDASIAPLPMSEKIYVTGSRPDIRVPMRKISQDDTPTDMALSGQTGEENPPVYVYDTSGPYTDPEVNIDIRDGLAPVRQNWIEERGDTELLDGPALILGKRGLLTKNWRRCALICNARRAAPSRAKMSAKCIMRGKAL